MPFYNPIAHPSVMIRRISLIKSGLYEIGTDGYEDFFLWKKLINFGQFKNTRKILLKYRIHDNQSTKKNNILLSKSYSLSFKPYNKSVNRVDKLYKNIITKKSNLIFLLLDYKFCKNYFISLITLPKSTLTLSYFYVINALLAKIYSKLIK
jgi:aminoglycoside N3'-acetyltransferase